MKEENNGSESAQGTDVAERQEEQAAQEKPVTANIDASSYEAQTAETIETLKSQIEELKKQGESDRIDFELRLAGVRNVSAASRDGVRGEDPQLGFQQVS